MNEVVDSLHGIFVYYCISYGPSYYSPRCQSGSFALHAEMRCTVIIALLSQFAQTLRLADYSLCGKTDCDV